MKGHAVLLVELPDIIAEHCHNRVNAVVVAAAGRFRRRFWKMPGDVLVEKSPYVSVFAAQAPGQRFLKSQ